MNKESYKGIITRGVGGLYGVRIEENGSYSEEILCRARGAFRHEQLTPTVGDDVIIIPASDEAADSSVVMEEKGKKKSQGGKNDVRVDYVIDEILQRRSIMIRPALSNLDYLFAVIPAASPEPDLLTADKLTVIAENYGIETVVVINKADLAPERAEEIAEIYKTAGYSVFKLSASSGEGVGELMDYIKTISANKDGREHVSGAFAGVSGAGKSTLMTALFPHLKLAAGKVSRKTERGRHTTRHVELYPTDLDGHIFWLADTPGFSMLDFTRFNFFPYSELASSFREFDDCIGNCKYTKCTHLKEEGCAVLEKMRDGKISTSRHDSYVRIYAEQRSVPEWKRR